MSKIRLAATVVAALATLAGGALPASAAPAAPAFGPVIDPSTYYEGQAKCSPDAKPGVVAFQQMVLAAYPGTGAGGIGRDCSIGGQSEHKEGRAWDWGVSVAAPAHREAVSDLLGWLVEPDRYGNEHALARRLGVMYLIWNKRIWFPLSGWRTYCVMKKNGNCVGDDGGIRSPHTDHVHFSFTWAGARKQTSYWNAERSLIGTVAGSPAGTGYWLAGRTGNVFGFGAGVFGSLEGGYSQKPVEAIEPTATGYGYWLVSRTGRVKAFGDARYRGSRTDGASPVVDMAGLPDGRGYWLVSRGGRVYSFGRAEGFGGAQGTGHEGAIVSMEATPTGLGYWLFGSNGAVFAFGDAKDFGGAANDSLGAEVVDGAAFGAEGYWLVTETGRVLSYGAAPDRGGATGKSLQGRVVGMATAAGGTGYWLATDRGQILSFGTARSLGSLVR
ncbi:MAG: hypothetical protein M3273_01440 [Actinomycetota bacterium]|nr:hypothetical protein [Actinomycetota bacterium]